MRLLDTVTIHNINTNKNGVEIASLFKRHDALVEHEPKLIFDLIAATDELDLIDYVLDHCGIESGTIPYATYESLVTQYHSSICA